MKDDDDIEGTDGVEQHLAKDMRRMVGRWLPHLGRGATFGEGHEEHDWSMAINLLYGKEERDGLRSRLMWWNTPHSLLAARAGDMEQHLGKIRGGQLVGGYRSIIINLSEGGGYHGGESCRGGFEARQFAQAATSELLHTNTILKSATRLDQSILSSSFVASCLL